MAGIRPFFRTSVCAPLAVAWAHRLESGQGCQLSGRIQSPSDCVEIPAQLDSPHRRSACGLLVSSRMRVPAKRPPINRARMVNRPGRRPRRSVRSEKHVSTASKGSSEGFTVRHPNHEQGVLEMPHVGLLEQDCVFGMVWTLDAAHLIRQGRQGFGIQSARPSASWAASTATARSGTSTSAGMPSTGASMGMRMDGRSPLFSTKMKPMLPVGVCCGLRRCSRRSVVLPSEADRVSAGSDASMASPGRSAFHPMISAYATCSGSSSSRSRGCGKRSELEATGAAQQYRGFVRLAQRDAPRQAVPAPVRALHRPTSHRFPPW